jgi:putative ABC transport system ATP-binding protein
MTRNRRLRVEQGPIYRIEGVTKVYRTGDVEVHALRGVDLEIAAGEFIVLLGPSGSGKSTLVNILGGLDSASGGRVLFRDDEITGFGEGELTRYRRDHVGFVFQFYNLVPSLTALENVALVTEIARDPMEPGAALELAGLAAERHDHFPAQLSGGEQQRVAIARAIAKKPEVLLCDEPTEALESINREFGTTVLVITHNIAVGAMADRVIHFADGRVARIEENETREAPASIAW